MRRRGRYPGTEQVASELWRYDRTHKGHRYKSPAIFETSEAAFLAMQAAIERGPERPKPPTLQALTVEWLEGVGPKRCRPSTMEDYRAIARIHIPPDVASLLVSNVTRKVIKDLLLEKIAQGLAASTVRHIQNLLANVLALAVDAEWLPANPAQSLGRLWDEKPTGADANPMTAQELRKLLYSFKSNRYYSLVLFLATTGCRFGEAAGLTWDQLNLDTGTALIDRTYSRGRTGLTKNGKSRQVAVPMETIGVLREHRLAQRKAALAGGYAPASLVFESRPGRPVDISVFRREDWARAVEDAGIGHRRLHDLRHTHATIRLEAGHDLAAISKQLGHSSEAFTLRQYVRWNPEARRKEMDALGKLMVGGK